MYSFQAQLSTGLLNVPQKKVVLFLAWIFRVERLAGKMLDRVLALCFFLLLGCFPNLATASLDQWTAVGLTTERVPTILIDPIKPSRLFAGTTTISQSPGQNKGIFRSDDGGATFTPTNIGLPLDPFYKDFPPIPLMGIDKSNSSVLYAVAKTLFGSDLYKSMDGGARWVKGRTFSKFLLSFTFDPITPSTIYAGTNGGLFAAIYKTVDAGSNWKIISNKTPLQDPFSLTVPNINAIVVDPERPSTVYAGTQSEFPPFVEGKIFKSTDGGATWLQATAGLATNGVIPAVTALALDPRQSTTLYAGTLRNGIFKSTDGGATWIPSSTINPFSAPISRIVVDPTNPARIFAATGVRDFFNISTVAQGVFMSTDAGATWQQINSGLSDLDVLDLVLDNSGTSTLYAGTSGSGVFKITVTDVLPAPTRLTARVGNASIYLQWGPLPQSADRYNIYVERFDTNANAFISLGIISPPTALTLRNTFDVFQLPNGEFSQNGQLYRFRVSAVKNNVEGPLSDFVLARPGQFAVSQAPSRPANPILFLHGICLFESFPTNATTWDTTKNFLTNTLGWRFGGELFYEVNDNPRLVLPQVRGDFFAGGDIFTVTFGNCQATYPDGGGLVHQGNEVRGFIQALSNNGVSGKVSLIAHSMGGIAARRYLAAQPDEARNRVAEFITYGSPNWGAPYGAIGDAIQSSVISNIPIPFTNISLASLADLFPVFRSGGARDTTVQCLNGQIDFSSNAFLNNLRSVPLPSGIRYFSIRGHSHDYIDHLSDLPASSSLLNCFSDHWDFFIPLDSANLGAIPIGAPAGQTLLTQGPVGLLTTNRNHLQETGDFSAILCALDPRCFVLTTRSPVDVEITAPDGRSLGKQLTEIPGAAYMELDDEIGHPIATTMIVFPLPGDYAIKVTPKTGAASTDTYTIEITRDGITTLLVQNQQLRDIPPQGFVVTVSPENKTPVANADLNQTVRLGSIIRLNGSASLDPDRGPSPLTYSWAQTSGPSAALTGNNSATPSFIASVAGEYIFTLNVSDGQASSAPSSVNITVPLLGDIDLNGDVDNNDLNLVLAARNKPASGPNDLRDLDGDGIITALDARKLTLLCTRARCAVQ